MNNNFYSGFILEFFVDLQNLMFLYIISYIVMIFMYENDQIEICRNDV